MRTVNVDAFSLHDVAPAVFRRPRPEKRPEPREFAMLTMKDLESFTEKCRREYPQIDHCSVYCEIMTDKSAFRVTQLMVDVNGHSVKSCNGEPVGRIVHAQRFDLCIHRKVNGVLPTEFGV